MTTQQAYEQAERELGAAREALLASDRRLNPRKTYGPGALSIKQIDAIYGADSVYVAARERFIVAVAKADRLFRAAARERRLAGKGN